MARRPDPAGRWRRAQTLVVDEVSMLDGALFDALEAVARAVRGSDAPFGGIQLVRCSARFFLEDINQILAWDCHSTLLYPQL